MEISKGNRQRFLQKIERSAATTADFFSISEGRVESYSSACKTRNRHFTGNKAALAEDLTAFLRIQWFS